MRKRIATLTICAAVGASVLYGCGGQQSSQEPQNTQQETPRENATEESAPEPQAEEKDDNNDGLINAEKFSQIESGMSYEEVVAIIGSEGKNTADAQAGNMTGESYQWDSDSWGSALITFVDGKVANKAQAGVDNDAATITAEMYDKIETGMTIDEVVNIIGGEGALASESEVGGLNAQVYTWYGKDGISNANITFSNGKVQSKAQIGLE